MNNLILGFMKKEIKEGKKRKKKKKVNPFSRRSGIKKTQNQFKSKLKEIKRFMN